MSIYKNFKLVKKIDVTIVENKDIFNILPTIVLSKCFGVVSLDLRWGTFEISFHTPFNTKAFKKIIDRIEKEMPFEEQI